MDKETEINKAQWKNHLKSQQLNFERCDKDISFSKEKIAYYKQVIKMEHREKLLYAMAIKRAKQVIKKYTK